MGKPVVKFGTDGWRGIIAADFTFANVRLAATAIANYLHASSDPKEAVAKGVCVGYDTRFESPLFARAVAEVLASSGIPVKLASRITPTPALSYAVRHLGAAGGVMITSSHNPYQWNGVKYKAWYGGSGKPSIMTAIESHLEQPLHKAGAPATIEEADFVPDYLDALRHFANLDLIAKSGFRIAVDCMYGAGAGILAGIFKDIGLDYMEIRAEHNPLFPGINPEPIEPHVRALQDAVVEHKCDAGLVTDGDADRIGAVDEHGNFVDPHKIFSILLEWVLSRKKWPGDVTRAFNTTCMIDRICERYGRKLHEHGIGFKFVVDLMLETDIVMGGEESGGIGLSRHLPERDGLLNALLLANVMAEERKTLGQLVGAMQEKYGWHEYGRIDLHIPDSLKNAAIARARAGVKKFAGMPVLSVETLDGIKFYLDNPEAKGLPNAAKTWLLLRASGTEPLLRIYSESCSKGSVTKLLEAAREFALSS
ncbi:MAG: phosphoglucomutase/phosphomannomutase family protein [Silvibacterium sp.]|nr:phosphoglucomutase/phosphomannomutase family protein [Silvibacterium sp.]